VSFCKVARRTAKCCCARVCTSVANVKCHCVEWQRAKRVKCHRVKWKRAKRVMSLCKVATCKACPPPPHGSLREAALAAAEPRLERRNEAGAATWRGLARVDAVQQRQVNSDERRLACRI
jgi:hypothetical protein